MRDGAIVTVWLCLSALRKETPPPLLLLRPQHHPPSLRHDQTEALMKEMFSNVPDKTPAVAPANENSEAGLGKTASLEELLLTTGS